MVPSPMYNDPTRWHNVDGSQVNNRAGFHNDRILQLPEALLHLYDSALNCVDYWTIKDHFYVSSPSITFLVQAPSKLTVFKWGPKWIRIFNSEAREIRAVGSREDLTILTATIRTVRSLGSWTVPRALAWTTTPNWPLPSCLPVHYLQSKPKLTLIL